MPQPEIVLRWWMREPTLEILQFDDGGYFVVLDPPSRREDEISTVLPFDTEEEAKEFVRDAREFGRLCRSGFVQLGDRFLESCHKHGIHLSFRAPICALGALKRRIERYGSVAEGD